MSGESEAEMTGEKAREQEGNAPNAPPGSTPEAEPNSAVADFRQGFFTQSRYKLLMALGEEPKEYQGMMDAYENLAWRFSRQSQKVHSPENLAALMAPQDQASVHLQ